MPARHDAPVTTNLPRERIVPYSGTIIFIGASTGGTEAIREVLTRLPADVPPILMTQHMPEMFTGSFARRLDLLSKMSVKEAIHGESIKPSVVYLAPGHSHLLIKKAPNGGYQCELSRSDPVNHHRPSVDVLFHSAAEQVGRAAIGVILTGMGKDGAAGMLRMMRAGAWTIGQDQATCVVYGMPREAVLLGAVKEVAPIEEVAARVLQRLRGGFHSHAEHPRV
ncbi:MAG: chemotaxis protein CheB [Azoarcus sp.]|jgi:two-component system chemotaxis response regulator CheB|nr:chemotaxis protein CheB [Azoarcus sp.]